MTGLGAPPARMLWMYSFKPKIIGTITILCQAVRGGESKVKGGREVPSSARGGGHC